MLASHRLSGFLSNFLEYSLLGSIQGGQTWATGSRPGDIVIYGVYSDGDDVIGTTGWTQLIKNVQQEGGELQRMVALYAKVLTATDISVGNANLSIDEQINVNSQFTITIRPTRPLSSISVTGLNNNYENRTPPGSPISDITMTSPTSNPGFVLAHLFSGAYDSPLLISNNIGQTEQLELGQEAQIQQHLVTLEFLREGMATTARTAANADVGTREYWQTIACITGQE
jgi:hypothetical protein